MSTQRERLCDQRDAAEAYVAVAAWLRRHAPELLDTFRCEVLDEGGITPQEWDEACVALQDYADRKAAGVVPDFLSLCTANRLSCEREREEHSNG